MPARIITRPGPAGGLRAGRRTLRRWSWRSSGGGLLSAPVRCRGETWYLVRVRGEAAAAVVLFERDGRTVGRRALRLAPAPTGERLAWLETPAGCKALRLELAADAAGVTDIELRQIADKDPVSHPLANVPRWSACLPPLRPSRVVLPESLASLAGMVDWIEVQVARPPASCAALAELIRGAVAVIDPAWCAALGLRWRELEALAADAWVLVDLESAARLRRAECRAWCDPVDIMSARIAYADVPTRGFALQDVLPYAFIDPRGRFGTRVIRATRAWRAAAARAAIVTVLSSETPWAARCGDVLAAQRLTPRGRLLLTDLPWLVSGALGRLLAPRLAAALLRVHLCGPVADHLQHWNRSDDTPIVVRDLADLSRRYPPLRAVRWQTGVDGVLHLGIALPAGPPPDSGVLTISTGRIDALDVHDGLPPEPLAIFMKWLAREWREQTDWARRRLAGRTIVWQFDAALGHKYAVEFDSAALLPSGPNTVVHLRVAGASNERAAPGTLLTLPADEGLLGDGSFEFQDELTRRLCRLIERSA